MVGGFGCPGTPFALIDELVRQGQRNLTIIKNDANEPSIGVGELIENDQVRKIITSHIGLNELAVEKMNDGSLEVEFHPQGILAEKIRIAGAGMLGFLTDIGVDTEFATHVPTMLWEGREVHIESALGADFALVHAECADEFGNLSYRAGAANFNPLMAMAAEHVIAETSELLPPGMLSPAAVDTPAPFVSTVVMLESLSAKYGVREPRAR